MLEATFWRPRRVWVVTPASCPARAREGRDRMDDEAEFDEFVVARSPALLRTAYLLVQDEALAEDLLQTSLTKAWFAWSRIEGDPSPTSAGSWSPPRRRGGDGGGRARRRRADLPDRVACGRGPGLAGPLGRHRAPAAAAAGGGGAALPRGPHRGGDGPVAGLLRRNGEEPVREGAGEAPARRGTGTSRGREEPAMKPEDLRGPGGARLDRRGSAARAPRRGARAHRTRAGAVGRSVQSGPPSSRWCSRSRRRRSSLNVHRHDTPPANPPRPAVTPTKPPEKPEDDRPAARPLVWAEGETVHVGQAHDRRGRRGRTTSMPPTTGPCSSPVVEPGFRTEQHLVHRRCGRRSRSGTPSGRVGVGLRRSESSDTGALRGLVGDGREAGPATPTTRASYVVYDTDQRAACVARFGGPDGTDRGGLHGAYVYWVPDDRSSGAWTSTGTAGSAGSTRESCGYDAVERTAEQGLRGRRTCAVGSPGRAHARPGSTREGAADRGRARTSGESARRLRARSGAARPRSAA